MQANRLTELTKSLSLADKNEKPTETEKLDPTTEKFLEKFRKVTIALQTSLDTVQDLINKLKDVHVLVFKATMSEEKKKCKKQVEALVSEIGNKNKSLRIELENMGTETDKRKVASGGKITPEIRIRESHHASLCIKFKNLIGVFSCVQEDFKKKSSEIAFKQYKITHPHKKDEEIREMIEQQDQKMEEKTLTKSQQGTLNAYYDEAVETRKDVLLIQQSLIELQDLFITMEKLVDQQDELLDNIEANLEHTVDDINAGVEIMKEAAGLSLLNTPFTLMNKIRGIKPKPDPKK
jgi:syntaxin 1B/2/3